MFLSFFLLPVTLRRANRAVVQVLRRKLSVKLPLHLYRACHHPRAAGNGDPRRAAVRRSRLHHPDRELKKRGLEGQRGK
jgi:hypothetical protein